jgi:hypothetical protein
MMLTARNFFTLLALTSAGGCATLSFLPAEATQTLVHPTHVEAYRTGTLAAHPGYGGKLDGFAVFNTGQAPPELAAQLADAIADPASYRDEVSAEEFVPDVGYRFYRLLDGGRGQWSLDVLISFDEDQVLLVGRDNKLHENFRRLIESTPGRGRFLQLSRQAFPFDDFVQSIQSVPATEPDQ